MQTFSLILPEFNFEDCSKTTGGNQVVWGGGSPAVKLSIYKTKNNPREVFWVFYLQKTLDILQQVETTVTAVVLQGNFTVGALHLICSKVPGRPTPDLPFWLQITKETNRHDLPETYTHCHTCRQSVLTPATAWRRVHEENVLGNP